MPLFTLGNYPKWGSILSLQPSPSKSVARTITNDYDRSAERAISQKIANYLAAGTLVVWDVDLRNEEVVAKYSLQNPQEPEIFRRVELANAEPAVPGWTLPVDSLFAPQRR